MQAIEKSKKIQIELKRVNNVWIRYNETKEVARSRRELKNFLQIELKLVKKLQMDSKSFITSERGWKMSERF